MKCTCIDDEVCQAHRLMWDFQLITQQLGNLLESELDAQKLFNQLPTVTEENSNEKRPNLSEQISQRT